MRMRAGAIVALLAACGAMNVRADNAPPAAATTPVDATMEKAIARVFPALVRIFVVMEEPGGGRMGKMQGSGSGAIISKDGYIISNHHVAGKARTLLCRMADGEEIEAELVGTDALADIAVLKLNLARRKNPAPLPVAEFGDSDRVAVGDTVFAMGSPMGVSQSITKGIVSNTKLMMPDMWASQFSLDGESVGSLVRWLGHDAVIYGGNSGGPLVNTAGEIIGINEIGLGSLGGAIPGNLAKSIANQIIASGSVQRSWTGIEPQPLLRGMEQERGVLVAGVIPGSPADQAGLRAGDIVKSFASSPVHARIQEDVPLFNALVLSTPVGTTVNVAFARGGKEQSCTLVTRPRGRARDNDHECKAWGITVRNLTMLGAIERKRGTNGVLVTSVDSVEAAGVAKPPLEEGDIITAIGGKPIVSMAEFRAATDPLTNGATNKEPVVVAFDRGITRLVTAVAIVEEDPSAENARKPGLGVLLQPVGPTLAKALGVKGGVRVTFVLPGRAAAVAGMQTGDIITAFDEDEVACETPVEIGHFTAKVRRHRCGDNVDCTVMRDGKSVKLSLTLDADDPDKEELKSYKDRTLELTVRELTAKERVLQQVPADIAGVRIDDVINAGWVSLAHVVPGDILMAIDNVPTPDVQTAERLLKERAKSKPRRIVFFIRRGVHTMFAEIEPRWETPAATASAK